MEILKQYTVTVPVNAAAINPTADKFVVGSADFGVYIYSIQTGEQLGMSDGFLFNLLLNGN
jgi:hypothetical protein